MAALSKNVWCHYSWCAQYSKRDNVSNMTCVSIDNQNWFRLWNAEPKFREVIQFLILYFERFAIQKAVTPILFSIPASSRPSKGLWDFDSFLDSKTKVGRWPPPPPGKYGTWDFEELSWKRPCSPTLKKNMGLRDFDGFVGLWGGGSFHSNPCNSCRNRSGSVKFQLWTRPGSLQNDAAH